jgi:hypothetical protein
MRPHPGEGSFTNRDGLFACGGFDVCDWGVCRGCFDPHAPAPVPVGFGRIVVSETEAPNLIMNLG